MFYRVFLFAALGLASGCATGDSLRLKAGRDFFAKGQFDRAELELYSPEVLKKKESRLQHFLWLSSLGVSEGRFEKALYYGNRARDLANELRSDRGGFEWLGGEYKSNPVEYSYLHYFLAISNLMLAEEGKTPAWSIPELKLPDGSVLVPAQVFPARVFDAKEIADFRTRARAELKAWNQFLEILKRTYPDQPFYQEDLLARILGSYVHGGSSTREERRTGELLAEQGLRILDAPSGLQGLDQNPDGLRGVFGRLARRAKSRPGPEGSRLVLIESGLMPELKEKKVVIGLSTIFEKVEDPALRFQIERIGLQILLETAPEFGLVALTGAVAGAASSGPDDSPKSLSGAIDRSFGFEISFPSIEIRQPFGDAKLVLSTPEGVRTEYPLQSFAPVREILTHELQMRREKEWLAKSAKVGLQYLAILVPAVIAYQQAKGEENGWLKRLAILAGFFIAKKAIDRANAPDLRSWSLLPEWISGEFLEIPPGTYGAEFRIREGQEEKHYPLGEWKVSLDGPFFFHRRVFDSGSRGL